MKKLDCVRKVLAPSLKSFFLAAALALFWSGCATVPKNFPAVEEDDFNLLPSGGRLYLWANIIEARTLIENISFDGFHLGETASVLDRSVTAAAVFNSRESTERFFLALRGNYPTFQAGFSMTFSRAWKKLKSATGNSYWYSPIYGLGMALGSTLALISGGDPFMSVPAGGTQVRLPEGFDEFRGGAAMAGWIPEPQETVNTFFTALGIPIQIPAEDFFFSVFQDIEEEEQWELVFHIRTPSVNQARAVLTLFSLARVFIVNSPVQGISDQTEITGITDFLPALFANLPHREEANIRLRTAALSTQDLSLLFEAFSIYSN